MSGALLVERVRRDLEVVAHGGLDLDTYLVESLTSLQRVVPFEAACLATVDPSTRLLTSTRKYGDLHGRDERDHDWGLIEYGVSESTAFTQLHDAGLRSAGVHQVTAGRVETSVRVGELIRPHYGYGDELRGLFLDRDHLWGALAIFRSTDDPPFDADEVEFLGSLAEVLGHGVRTGLLASLAVSAPVNSPAGPAVMIVGDDDTVVQVNAGAERWLNELVLSAAGAAPSGIVGSLVGAARRFARGECAQPPRARVRTASGLWLVLHATPLSPRGGATSEVVVTIEEARPPEIVPLVVAAFGLTARERDVTAYVLQGSDTKEIAAALHLSVWTIQDHLKSIFEKASVRSRRELIARVYFDQYVPRMGHPVGPGGWFAG
ncbi:MAG TPA: helix-turn-helix transcriptional regulator [Microlunatus sp.]|nr:helix-turn-helix transcriptional regulator [Microlunatus sp.]